MAGVATYNATGFHTGGGGGGGGGEGVGDDSWFDTQ